MKPQSLSMRAAGVARNKRAIRQQQRKKYISIILMVLAMLVMLAGIQGMLYYSRYVPRVNEINDQLAAFMQEKTTTTVQGRVQEQFRSLIEELKPEEVYARQVLEQFEILIKFFRQTPLQITVEVRDALLTLSEQFKVDGETEVKPILIQASADLKTLAADLDILREIYTIEFNQLQSDLESPPWYLWPTGHMVRYQTGYLSAVTFNRAMYLSQIGESGTARVLLTGLYSSPDNKAMQGLIFYGLGRLQWELFTTTTQPENYFQAVKYIRQSIQTDPKMELSTRVFDFMMSLSQGDSAPRAGEGDPTNPSEGEAASVSETTPMF